MTGRKIQWDNMMPVFGPPKKKLSWRLLSFSPKYVLLFKWPGTNFSPPTRWKGEIWNIAQLKLSHTFNIQRLEGRWAWVLACSLLHEVLGADHKPGRPAASTWAGGGNKARCQTGEAGGPHSTSRERKEARVLGRIEMGGCLKWWFYSTFKERKRAAHSRLGKASQRGMDKQVWPEQMIHV